MKTLKILLLAFCLVGTTAICATAQSVALNADLLKGRRLIGYVEVSGGVARHVHDKISIVLTFSEEMPLKGKFVLGTGETWEDLVELNDGTISLPFYAPPRDAELHTREFTVKITKRSKVELSASYETPWRQFRHTHSVFLWEQ